MRVAVIPGDGVGPEVIAEGRRVLETAGYQVGAALELVTLPWGSRHFKQNGSMMPPDGLERLEEFDAIYLGAVGDPDVPDHLTIWGLILPIRKRFDQYVNLRPVRWLSGVPARLAGKHPADVDMVFIRENVEGEYADLGGRLYGGTAEELALQTSVFTRRGVERIARYAFETARGRRGRVTSVTKSNALRHTAVLWDEVVDEMAGRYPDVELRRMLVDAAAYRLVVSPEEFDVVVASNLFGDILTDLGGALQGSLGLAASANLDPSGRHPSMFEPVHGSAPDIAGAGVANPGGAIWAGALMLEHLGLPEAGRLVMQALERTLGDGILTVDLGGEYGTKAFADEVVARLTPDSGPPTAHR